MMRTTKEKKEELQQAWTRRTRTTEEGTKMKRGRTSVEEQGAGADQEGKRTRVKRMPQSEGEADSRQGDQDTRGVVPRDDATALQGKGTHRGQRPSHKCGVGGARHSATDSFRGEA